jgi:hypothetical protein
VESIAFKKQFDVQTFEYKDGDENGSYVYQAMLNTMQVLPVTDIFEISNTYPLALVSIPQKRKSSNIISRNKKEGRITNKTYRKNGYTSNA